MWVTISEQKFLVLPKGKMTHMQNVNTYTLCAKQPKRGREYGKLQKILLWTHSQIFKPAKY